DNNMWGEGRLDAYAAVTQSPRGPSGTLSGTVTSGGSPVAGATVSAAGPINRSTQTDASGNYAMTLSVGTYSVTAAKFGYVGQTVNGIAVSDGATTDREFSL